MAQRQRDDFAVDDESRSHAGAQADVEHPASFVAAQGLHAGVVHDPHRTTEDGRKVAAHPAGAEIDGIGHGAAVDHFAGITEGDPLKSPFLGDLPDFFHKHVRREILAGGEFHFVGLAGLPDLDVRAADIHHESIHVLFSLSLEWTPSHRRTFRVDQFGLGNRRSADLLIERGSSANRHRLQVYRLAFPSGTVQSLNDAHVGQTFPSRRLRVAPSCTHCEK